VIAILEKKTEVLKMKVELLLMTLENVKAANDK
jgi:hypothetical protein